MNPRPTPCEDHAEDRKSSYGLEHLGLEGYRKAYWNLPAEGYYEESIYRDEGIIARHGPLLVKPGQHTARAADDKFIVEEESSRDDISWGEYNVPYPPHRFHRLHQRMKSYLKGKDLFVQDGYAGVHKEHQLNIRVVSTHAWQGLFTQNMFITPESLQEYRGHVPELTILAAPDFKGNPQKDQLHSETFILLNFQERLVLIGNTGYGGEIKKSVFTAMNYLLPNNDVLTMHCSANVGEQGDTALFFGLSGTGKTTLSADPNRQLIGDDEHGWDEKGVFNFEDGSYAKVIDLSPEDEPDIYATTQRFGTVLENVIYDPLTREIDLSDDSITTNTRASYPLHFINYALPQKQGGHPENIIFLTYDAYGVMPPLSRLSTEQALFHFISGFTSKVGGTEAGVGDSPEVTFSACFGAPFMVHHPVRYAKLLQDKLVEHQVDTWLLNTGLVGGPHGIGERISIRYTRALLTAVLEGDLQDAEFRTDDYFGFQIPTECAQVPADILYPSSLWDDQEAYHRKYCQLVKKFQQNIQRYAEDIPPEILDAGPSIPE